MENRLLDRIWNRIANRYDGDDDGDCGCGTVLEGDQRGGESDGDENGNRERAI